MKRIGRAFGGMCASVAYPVLECQLVNPVAMPKSPHHLLTLMEVPFKCIIMNFMVTFHQSAHLYYFVLFLVDYATPLCCYEGCGMVIFCIRIRAGYTVRITQGKSFITGDQVNSDELILLYIIRQEPI